MSSPATPCRRCSRQTCTRDAVMTLTFVYSDSTAVVGPLAGHAEPHAYDLCGVHADRLTVPRGWRVVRLEPPEARARREDIGAVAEAVREAEPQPPAPVRGRRGTVLRDVSLPRTTTPAPRSGRETGPAARRVRERASVPLPGREPGSATGPEPEPVSAPRPEPEAATGARPGREPAPLPRRGSVPDLVWHDVPMPESLHRAHLRRPAARADRARPQA